MPPDFIDTSNPAPDDASLPRQPGARTLPRGDAIAGIGYGDHESQMGDLRLPDRERAPVVCLVHGGFWRLPWARDQMGAIARDLAVRGHVVWNIGYRRVGEAGGGWPGTLDDVATAVDLLATLASHRPEIDLGRVVVAGHSGGAQLAFALAAREARRVKPLAYVALGGVFDLHAAHAHRESRDAVARFVGGDPVDRPREYARASPRSLLPLGVPLVVIHSAADEVIDVSTARAFVDIARASGDRVDYREVKAGGHKDHLDPSSPAHGAFLRVLDEVFGPA